MKYLKEAIGNRNRNLPVFSAVSHSVSRLGSCLSSQTVSVVSSWFSRLIRVGQFGYIISL